LTIGRALKPSQLRLRLARFSPTPTETSARSEPQSPPTAARYVCLGWASFIVYQDLREPSRCRDSTGAIHCTTEARRRRPCRCRTGRQPAIAPPTAAESCIAPADHESTRLDVQPHSRCRSTRRSARGILRGGCSGALGSSSSKRLIGAARQRSNSGRTSLGVCCSRPCEPEPDRDAARLLFHAKARPVGGQRVVSALPLPYRSGHPTGRRAVAAPSPTRFLRSAASRRARRHRAPRSSGPCSTSGGARASSRAPAQWGSGAGCCARARRTRIR
jgi:hypothetical protein